MTRSDVLPLSTAFCTVSDEQAMRSWITAAPLPAARVEDTNARAASGKRPARSSARPSGTAAGGDGRGVDTGGGAVAGATVGGAGRDDAAAVEGASDGAAGRGEGTTLASVVGGVGGRGEVAALGAGDARAKSLKPPGLPLK